MKVFVSQPMTGIRKEDIEAIFRIAEKDIRNRFSNQNTPVEILSTRNYELPKCLQRGHNQSIAMLSHSIQVLSMADAIYLCPGWYNSLGCTAEANIAKMYRLVILQPEEDANAGRQ